jgi:hypothetical protein
MPIPIYLRSSISIRALNANIMGARLFARPASSAGDH